MNYFVRNMTNEIAKIVLEWKYEPPYDFYNSQVTKGNIAELVEHGYYSVVDDKEQVVGFFCTGGAAQVPVGHLHGVYDGEFIDVGFGLRPELTGKGYGYPFLQCILGFVETTFHQSRFRLTVAAFNERAIHLYKKAGFKPIADFETETSDFIVMVKESES